VRQEALVADAGSAYGNPQPYPSISLERHALEGRLKVARSISTSRRQSGDITRAERWEKIADELLDHLNALEDRAKSAAIQEEHTAEGSS
jgi:hypothetical protein